MVCGSSAEKSITYSDAEFVALINNTRRIPCLRKAYVCRSLPLCTQTFHLSRLLRWWFWCGTSVARLATLCRRCCYLYRSVVITVLSMAVLEH